MEDGKYLTKEDKKKLISLKVELDKLKVEQEYFTKRHNSLTKDEKDTWRGISRRMNEVSNELKELRHKNIIEAGKSL